MSKRSILRSLVQLKRAVMGLVSITFFFICLVILLNHLNPA
jgi:hypothetical protein